jgi:hypothetical protein
VVDWSLSAARRILLLIIILRPPLHAIAPAATDHQKHAAALLNAHANLLDRPFFSP